MVTPRVSNMAGICAQVPTPGLSCSLEWLCFRSSLVWCKNPKNNEFRTKKFPNQEFLYGISSFCTLSENNCFLHVKISCFCIFLAKYGVFNTNRTPRVVYGNPTLRAMHSIHKCVAKGAPHLWIDGCRVCPLDARYKNRTKQPLVWASSHRGIPFYFCMARNFQFTSIQWK